MGHRGRAPSRVIPTAHAGDSLSSGECATSPRVLDHPAGTALEEVLERARCGVVVPAGAIEPGSLTKNRPADVQVRLGPDPLGLAAALGVDPAAFWRGARAEVIAAGPGFSVRGRIRADGSAGLTVTPPSPGAVYMRLVVPATSIQRALGTPKRGEKRFKGGWYSLPGGTGQWGLESALVPLGQPSGSPVLEVEDLPEPPPDPGGEPSPEPAPIPGPEAQP